MDIEDTVKINKNVYDKFMVKAMEQQVLDCTVTLADGRLTNKKVMYLTNTQADLYTDQDMEQCIQKLGLRNANPQFVIKLCASFGFHSQVYYSHPQVVENPLYKFTEFAPFPIQSSEISQHDERVVETQVLLFMRTCIIPLAKETRAIIIISGTNDCFLGASFSRIAMEEQRRLGSACPFTVVALSGAGQFVQNLMKPQTFGAQLFKKLWDKPGIKESMVFLESASIIGGSLSGMCDLNPAASAFLIFDNLDAGNKINTGPQIAFESRLLQHLTKRLPSVAIQSHRIYSRVANVAGLVDLAKRNIPVLLLDASERAFTCKEPTLLDKDSYYKSNEDASKLSPKEEYQGRRKSNVHETNLVVPPVTSRGINWLGNLTQRKEKPTITPRPDIESEGDRLAPPVHRLSLPLVDSNLNDIENQRVLHEIPIRGDRESESDQQTVVNEALAARDPSLLSRSFVPCRTDLAEKYNAFPEISTDQLKSLIIHNGSVHPDSRLQILKWAKNMVREKLDVHIKKGKPDRLETSVLAFFHTVLRLGASSPHFTNTRNRGSLIAAAPLYQKIELLEELERRSEESRHTIVPAELAADAVRFILKLGEAYKDRARLAELKLWKQLDDVEKDEMQKKYKEVLNKAVASFTALWNRANKKPSEGSNASDRPSDVPSELLRKLVEQILRNFRSNPLFISIDSQTGEVKCDENLNQKIERALNDMEKRVKKAEDENGYFEPYDVIAAENRDSKWLAYYDILTHPKVFSGSLFEPGELKRRLFMIADLGRLPEENSLESLRCLRDAWDHVEMYEAMAMAYKLTSKRTYYMLLCSAIFITICAVLETQLPYFPADYIIVAFSFLTTILVAYVSFTNPTVRWQQFRKAQSNMESEIWMFRTRAGIYHSEMSDEVYDQAADEKFALAIKEIKDSVEASGDIKNTSFYSKFKSCKGHHQRRAEGSSLLSGHGICSNVLGYLFSRKRFSKEKQDAKNLFEVYYEHDKTAATEAPGNNGKNSTIGQILPAESVPSPTKGYRVSEVFSFFEGRGEIVAQDDNFCDLLPPEQYLELRVRNRIQFYKKRIPSNNNLRYLSQIVLVLFSVITSALAFLRMSPLTAIVSILTSSVSAFMEFNGINGKVQRYSSIVHALEQLEVWWSSLTRIQRHDLSNVDLLVMECEGLIRNEVQSWMSSSQTTRMLIKLAQLQDKNK